MPQREFKHRTILYHHRTRAKDGQSVHIDELTSALAALGHRVVIVAPQRSVTTVSRQGQRVLPAWLYELLECAYNVVEAFKLTRAVRRYKPDILYERGNVFMVSGIGIARLFRLPYIVEVNAPLAQERAAYGNLALFRLAAWTERLTWRAASAVLPVSAVLGRMVAAAGVEATRIAVIPNAVDMGAFQSPFVSSAQEVSLPSCSTLLGFAGVLREWSGLELVFDALAHHPALAAVGCVIIGDGPLRPALQEQVNRLGLAQRVLFLGTVPRASIPNYMQRMDIALLPSATSYSSPLKLFEYMAMRRAIIAIDQPNIREIVTHESNALLAAPGDVSALAHCIERLADNPSLRAQLGDAAYTTLMERRCTWKDNALRVSLLMDEISMSSPYQEARST